MYCPQCGTESSSELKYCRSCGANLKVIGKALALSEAIARSDRGPLPKIKEMFKNLHIEKVTDEVSRALERMNTEILSSSPPSIEKKSRKPAKRREKTAEERREIQIGKGTVSLFTGIGLTVFLYFLSEVLVLKLPPDVLAKIPFELDPVIRVIWLLGLVPVFTGAGRIISGLMIRTEPREVLADASISENVIDESIDQPLLQEPLTPASSPKHRVAASVTEHTTNLLEPPR